MTPLLPPPDLSGYFSCEYLSEGSERFCGKPAVASAEGPMGQRVPLCGKHEAQALRWVLDPRWSEWSVAS